MGSAKRSEIILGSPKRTSTYNGTSQQTTALLRLREMLLSGEFTPGKRLPEIPLANRLGVSRTPLRLALSALEHEGLLEESPTRGYIVRSFQRTDIFDLIEIRGLLEGMAWTPGCGARSLHRSAA